MILLVDDEVRYTDVIVTELEGAGYEVCAHRNIDTALKFFEEHLGQIELLILDIFMPWGASFTMEETEYGMRTGVRFYERVREKEAVLPVIVLTHAADPMLRKFFNGESNCWYRQKLDLMPFELAYLIKEILTRH